jgi:hypothetical protein
MPYSRSGNATGILRTNPSDYQDQSFRSGKHLENTQKMLFGFRFLVDYVLPNTMPYHIEYPFHLDQSIG